MSVLGWMALSLAGAVGAPLRYVVDGAVQGRSGGAFPWGTCVVNLAGSFVLGVVTGLVVQHDLSSTGMAVVGAGLCGAFTTFSTFSYETLRLLQAGAVGLALRNVSLTLVAAGSAAALGWALGQAL